MTSNLVKEFMELVQIDSETKHEEKISPVLIEKLQAMGFEVYQDDAHISIATLLQRSKLVLTCFSPVILCRKLKQVL